MISRRVFAGIILIAVSTTSIASAGQFDSILRWRNVGPYRGGRTRAVCGVPSQPNVFYMAAVNGGVFRSTDYGRTWQPIFDDQPPASVGSIPGGPANPHNVYF